MQNIETKRISLKNAGVDALDGDSSEDRRIINQIMADEYDLNSLMAGKPRSGDGKTRNPQFQMNHC